MLNKDNFEKGENVSLNIYSYDDQGNEYCKVIEGSVYQITENFVVIDNGVYKESFKYSELEKNGYKIDDNEPYDLSVENYEDDVVEDCLNSLNKNKEGFVFNYEQLEKVFNKIGSRNGFTTRVEDKIIYIKDIR